MQTIRGLAVFTFSVLSASAGTIHRCLPCHAQQVESFRRSAMARSLSEPVQLPKATVHPPGSSVEIQIEYKNGRMLHRESVNGASGEYPIRFAVGSGNVGQSFLVEVGGHLVQSPVSYYSASGKWDLTPGYEGARVPGF